MSDLRYGRITPMQMYMLELGGEVLGFSDVKHTDNKIIENMVESRHILCKKTGQDFGFDLHSWHLYLIDSEQHGGQYMFPYAWNVVQRKILELIQDPNRIRLQRLAETSEAE